MVITPIQQPAPAGVFITCSADIQPQLVQPLINTVNIAIAEGHGEVNLLINSNGGSVNVGVALYNILRGMPITMVTHNVGNVDSIANIVFLAGDRRYSAPQATFMFHGVASAFGGGVLSGQQAREVARNIQADEDRIAAIIAERSNLGVATIREFFREAATKDAAYAASAGLIDEIRVPEIPQGSTILSVG